MHDAPKSLWLREPLPRSPTSTPPLLCFAPILHISNMSAVHQTDMSPSNAERAAIAASLIDVSEEFVADVSRGARQLAKKAGRPSATVRGGPRPPRRTASALPARSAPRGATQRHAGSSGSREGRSLVLVCIVGQAVLLTCSSPCLSVSRLPCLGSPI